MANNKNFKFWIPLGIYLGITLISGSLPFFFHRNIEIAEWGDFMIHLASGIRPVSFIVAFCVFFLYGKNRNYLFGLLLLYVLAFSYPWLIGKHNILLSCYSLVYSFISSCNALILYLASDWFIKQQRTQELEKKNLQSELAMLKNQINPHFLFNTLNNIDSMIKKNPDCASQSIVELSDMMRYMIYEANIEKVPLKKELDYIDNFLHLQKLQYGNQELVEYTLSGEPEQIEVAPMLFIPFVENAFKHCTNKEIKQAIRFSFVFDAREIRFEALNIADKTQAISKDKTSGIGLDTVKRRLEILYPNRHDLEIQEKNDLFCVSLTLKIDD